MNFSASKTFRAAKSRWIHWKRKFWSIFRKFSQEKFGELFSSEEIPFPMQLENKNSEDLELRMHRENRRSRFVRSIRFLLNRRLMNFQKSPIERDQEAVFDVKSRVNFRISRIQRPASLVLEEKSILSISLIELRKKTETFFKPPFVQHPMSVMMFSCFPTRFIVSNSFSKFSTSSFVASPWNKTRRKNEFSKREKVSFLQPNL